MLVPTTVCATVVGVYATEGHLSALQHNAERDYTDGQIQAANGNLYLIFSLHLRGFGNLGAAA